MIIKKIIPKFSTINYCRQSAFIVSACWGNCSISLFASAISKSLKSKPGETVQPTREKSLSGAGILANQQLAGTTY